MEESRRAWGKKVEEVCLLLTPPLLVASPDSWYYPQGDTEIDRKEATNRIISFRRWVERDVTPLLETLHGLMMEIEESGRDDVSIQTKCCIAIAAAVYVSPRIGAKPTRGDQSSSSHSREPWINPANTKLAKIILSNPLLCVASKGGPGMACLDITLVSTILNDFLKPLFSSTPSRNINASTGRATKANSNLGDGTVLTSTATLMEDEIIWKGGDVEAAGKMDLLGRNVLFNVNVEDACLQRRHRGLGSCSILYICCHSIHVSQSSGTSSWDQLWHLVLPPLLILLEDSSPLYRLLGSRILNSTLLRSNDKEAQVGSLLLRTGVAVFIRQNLESSLTFISAKLSAPLLQSAAESIIRLSQITTADMRQSNQAISMQHVTQDKGRNRFEQLSKLVDEGVLRVWAYAPASVSALESEGEAAVVNTNSQMAAVEDEKIVMQYEASDVVDASINVVTRLTQDDALDVGIARYLDVVLEFLTAQLMGLEDKLDRRKESKRAMVSLEREICSARAIESLLIVCKRAPGLRTWSSRCLDGAARCWTLLQDQERTPQVEDLFLHLRGFIKALKDALPELMQAQTDKLLELDKALFEPLIG